MVFTGGLWREGIHSTYPQPSIPDGGPDIPSAFCFQKDSVPPVLVGTLTAVG